MTTTHSTCTSVEPLTHTQPGPVHVEAVSDSESHGIENGEDNPLIRYDAHHHMKPLSPTPCDSMRSADTDPQILTLKKARPTPDFIFSHAGHYYTATQLVEHINLIVMSYVTQHNNLIHNPETLLSSEDIQCTLQKLRSQLIPTEKTDKSEPNDALDGILKIIPMAQNISNEVSEVSELPSNIPIKYFSSHDVPAIYRLHAQSSEHSAIPITHMFSHELQPLAPRKLSISHEVEEGVEEFRNTKKTQAAATAKKVALQKRPKQPTSSSMKLKWCTFSFRSEWPEYIPSAALLHHPKYSINVDKYCGKLRGSVRQDWNTIETGGDEERNWEELKPHWFELFFDLMFVAAIVHISSEVADSYNHGETMFIYTVFPQFGLMIICWLQQVLYHSRFRMTQTGDGLLRFFYISLVLLMGLSIGNMKAQTSHDLFLVSYMFTKIIMSIMFVKSSLILRARAHSIYMITENLVSIAAIIAILICVNISPTFYSQWPWFWCAIYSILFTYSWIYVAVLVYAKCIREKGINIPINVPHVAERMGAFVLIILGETIISIMVQHVSSTMKGILTAYGVTMSLFIIVYCIGKLYFESQPSEHELHHHKKSHAMSSSVWRARIYKWFHMVLFFGLLGLGLGCKITVHELPHYDMHQALFIFVPGISCCVICCAINIIRLTHPFDYSEEKRGLVIAVWCVRVACVCAMLAILFSWNHIHHFIIMAVYVLSFLIQVLVDFEARRRLIITKALDKDKSLLYYKTQRGTMGKHPSHEVSVMSHTKDISCIGAF